MKKVISLILTAIILCGGFTVCAQSAEPVPENPTQSEEIPEILLGEKQAPWNYVFKIYSKEEIRILSEAIAEKAEIYVGYDEFGTEVYWISLRITENPELANTSVLKSAAQKMVENAKAMFTEQSLNPDTISLDHFTGELFMHVIAILVMDTLIEVLWPAFDSYYEMFDLAEMNPDEVRLPPFLLRLFGTIIIGLF